MAANQLLGSIVVLLFIIGLAAGEIVIQRNSLDSIGELFGEGNGAINSIILTTQAEPEEYDAVGSRLPYPFNMFAKSTPIPQPAVVHLSIQFSVPQFGKNENLFPLPPPDYEPRRPSLYQSRRSMENFGDFYKIPDFVQKPVGLLYDLDEEQTPPDYVPRRHLSNVDNSDEIPGFIQKRIASNLNSFFTELFAKSVKSPENFGDPDKIPDFMQKPVGLRYDFDEDQLMPQLDSLLSELFAEDDADDDSDSKEDVLIALDESVKSPENFGDPDKIPDFMQKPCVRDLDSLLSELFAEYDDDNDSKENELIDSDNNEVGDKSDDKNIENFEQDTVKSEQKIVGDPDKIPDFMPKPVERDLDSLLSELFAKYSKENELIDTDNNEVGDKSDDKKYKNIENFEQDTVKSEQKIVADEIIQDNEHSNENEHTETITTIDSASEEPPKYLQTIVIIDENDTEKDEEVTDGDIKTLYYVEPKAEESAESKENTQAVAVGGQLDPKAVEFDDNAIYLKSLAKDTSKESAESNEKTEVPLLLNTNFLYNTNTEAKDNADYLEYEDIQTTSKTFDENAYTDDDYTYHINSLI